MAETRSRSLAKSISRGAIATLETLTISPIFTRSVSYALKIGAAELVSKIILFYLHERLWEHVKYLAQKGY